MDGRGHHQGKDQQPARGPVGEAGGESGDDGDGHGVDQQHVHRRAGEQQGFLQRGDHAEQDRDLGQAERDRQGCPYQDLQHHRDERAGQPPEEGHP